MKVLILGASGFLGRRLAHYLRISNIEVFPQSRAAREGYLHFPLKSIELGEQIDRVQPDLVVNCAAETSVSSCERDWQRAVNGNVLPSLELLKAIAGLDRPPRIVHISTDQVYSDQGPSTETEACPVNNYGKSKHIGELPLEGKAIVLRTNFVGSGRGNRKTFSDWVHQTCVENHPVELYSDIKFNPVHIDDLCDLVSKITTFDLENGVYNFGCIGCVSKAEFYRRFSELSASNNPNTSVVRYSDKTDLPTKPLDMLMDTKKIKSRGIDPPSIDSVFKKLVKEYM